MRVAILANTMPAEIDMTAYGKHYRWRCASRGHRYFLLYQQVLTNYTLAPYPKAGPWVFKRSGQCVYL